MTPASTIRLTGARSQRAFDVFLRTLAEPGSVRPLPEDVPGPGIDPVGTLALALADVDVGISVDDRKGHPLALAVADATGCSIVEIETASFVTLTTPDTALLARCNVGSALEPERGARVAVAVERLWLDGDTLELTGPGVPVVRRLGIDGLPDTFLGELAHRNRSFPAGIDLWFVDRDRQVAAVSRSTRFTIIEES